MLTTTFPLAVIPERRRGELSAFRTDWPFLTFRSEKEVQRDLASLLLPRFPLEPRRDSLDFFPDSFHLAGVLPAIPVAVRKGLGIFFYTLLHVSSLKDHMSK